MATDLDNLPEDVEALRAALRLVHSQNIELAARNAELETINQRLAELLGYYKRLKFGRTSEKLHPDQLKLALEDVEQAIARMEHAADQVSPARREQSHRRRSSEQRPSLPDSLPVVEVVISPKSTTCPCCNRGMHQIDETVSKRLDVQPIQYRIVVTRRPKYACRACEGAIVQAPAPARLVEGGLPTEALVAQVLVAKHADHTPLYRQAEAMGRQGIRIHRSVLAGWVGMAAQELAPVYEAMRRQLLTSSLLFMDETRAPVLDPGRGQTKSGYFWTLLRDPRGWGGDEPLCLVYAYAPGRGAVHARELLKDFKGTIQVDGYAAYETLAAERQGSLRLANCWSHARREFYDLFKPDGSTPIAAEALRRIAKMYQAEAETRGRPPDERVMIRQETLKPLMETFRIWGMDQLCTLMSNARVAGAVRYALERWEGLTICLEDGRVEMDSNPIERMIKPIVLTRKNSLFAGHDDAAQNWAIVASLIQTCRLHGVDPQAYLTDVLTRLVNLWPNSRIDELLPWKWRTEAA
jgi:transposase